MPKERINPSAGEPRDPYEVQVGWSKDRDVQVGVETADGTSLLWALFGDEQNLERFGAEMIGIVQSFVAGRSVFEDVTTEEDKQRTAIEFARNLLNLIESGGAGNYFVSEHGTAFYTGVWSTLDRRDCNRAIRALRRARDQAFGRDE